MIAVKAAIIGYGGIAVTHEQVLKSLGHEIVAVCDNDPKKLERADAPLKFLDYREMLDSISADVVHICTPHYLHADMIICALSRNFNVLCEKPLCIKEEDVERIAKVEKNSKGQLGICFQNRYNPINIYIKNYLEGKTLKCATASMVWNRDEKYYATAKWRGKWATEGGGVLINQSIHTLDLLLWFTGMPEYIRATVDNIRTKEFIEVEDTAVISGYGKAPFTFFATNSSAVNYPVEFTLNVDGVWLKYFNNILYIGDKAITFEEATKAYGKSEYGSGHTGLIADFYDCIGTGRKFEIDASEAAKAVKVVFAAFKSSKTENKIIL